MWEKIYDSFLQAMTVSWAEFIRLNKTPGRAVRDSFQSNIYPDIAIYMLTVPLVFSLLFYYYFNFRFGKYYSKKSWLITLVISSISVALITYLRSAAILDDPIIDVSQHLFWISIINSIYAAILFAFYSIIIKWKSPMGKRTPF
jgi:hypothetical protein